MAGNRMPDYISVNEPEDDPGLFVPQAPQVPQASAFSTNSLAASRQQSGSHDSYMTDDLSRMIAQASRQGGWKSPSNPTPNQQQQGQALNQNNGTNHDAMKARSPVAASPITNGQQQASQSTQPTVPIVKPNFLIFGAAEDDLSFIIAKKSLQNLPDSVLQRLSTKGNIVGPSVYMTNYDQLESMIRLKDYLEQKQYRPFNPQVALEYTDVDGKIKTWQAPKRAVESLQSLKLTPATQDLFSKEVDLYLFAAELNYDELRRLSLNHIINRYPKSIETVWTMIHKLYSAVHPEDRLLRQHVVDLITVNREELTSHESFSGYMRRFVKIEGALGETLFDAYTKVLADVKRRVNDGGNIRKTSLPLVKQESLEPATTPIKRSVSEAYSDSPRHKVDEGWDPRHIRPSDLPKIADAFLQQRLVVAKKSGYGTLVRPDAPRTRNRDFQFSAGELLLVKSTEVDSSRNAHNILIYNSAGEKGDVLAELVCDFPDDLGVRLRAGPIEWGQLYQLPRLQATTSTNGASGRDDLGHKDFYSKKIRHD